MNYISPARGIYLSANGCHVTKKDLLRYITWYSGCSEYEVVSDFDSQKARHICKGKKSISLLDKQMIGIPINVNSTVWVEIFYCPYCRKLLINGQSLEVL